MTPGHTFVDDLLAAVTGGAIDGDTTALRWFGDVFPGARGAYRGTRIREEVTFAALARRVERTAAGLRAAGMLPGDRMLFSIRPRPEGVVLCLAVIHLGGSVVFVDPGSTPALFEARLAAAGPRWAATEALLYAASSGPFARVARARGLLLPRYAKLPVRHLHSGRRLPGVPRGATRVAQLGGGELAEGGPAPERREAGHPDPTEAREALVVFTSGTTSDPRAVVHTTASLAGMLTLFAQVGDLRPGRRAHTDQLFLGLPALLAGGTWEIPARTPSADPVAFARGVAHADSSFAVPADVTALLDAVEAARRADGIRRATGRAVPRPWVFPHRRVARAGPGAGPRVMAVGAAPVTPALMERACRVLPETRWVGVYGATEMLPVAVVDGRDKVAAAHAERTERAASAAAPSTAAPGDLVGVPLRGVTARIDAPDEAGVGELVVSGPSLMAGYLADLDAGRAPVVEHRTGDLARMDDAGHLTLVGRTRDMIIRGTVNIYPGLFEPRIRALPGVEDALLVGIPRRDGDERVALVLVADRDRTPGSGAAVPALDERTPLVRAVEPRLPGILDHGALPDVVIEASFVPLSGRSRKPDRAALVSAVTAFLGGGHPQVTGRA